MYETRQSAAGNFVAIRNRPDDANPWSVSNGTFASDAWVADWTLLAPAPADEPADHWYRKEPVALEYRLILNRSGNVERGVALEIHDGTSSTPLIEAEFDADQFLELMTGRTPGSVDGVPSRVARRSLLERIGQPMNNFSVMFKSSTDEDKLIAWAGATAAVIDIAAGAPITTNVKRVRDGVRVTWRAYGPMTRDEIDITDQRLNAAADDFRAEV